MKATSSESLLCGGLLVLFGMLALYGGASWLGGLIPAAVVLWLTARARAQARRIDVDARVENRTVGR